MRITGVDVPIWMLLLGAIVACAITWLAYSAGVAMLAATAYLVVLQVITIIDWKRHIIPNIISLPAICIALATIPLRTDVTWLALLLGGVFAGGLVLAISLLGGLLFRKQAMGWGDIKLALFIGLVVGWPAVVISIYVTIIAGGLTAAVMMLSRRTRVGGYLAYGPFLALGGAMGLLWGRAIWLWYTGGMG